MVTAAPAAPRVRAIAVHLRPTSGGRFGLMVLVLLALFSPLFDVGVYLRIDQLLFAAVFLAAIALDRSVPIPGPAQVFLLLALSWSLLATLASAVNGLPHVAFMVNQPGKIGLSVVAVLGVLRLTAKRDGERSLVTGDAVQLLFGGTFAVGLLAILQVLEFHGFIPRLGINDVLSSVYPYSSVMREGELTKTAGLQLQMGSAGRATAEFEGHPILLGDYLAFALVLLIPAVRRGWQLLAYLLPLLALLLTLSRGSILGWLVGVTAYAALLGFTLVITRGFQRHLVRVVSAAVVLAALVLSLVITTPLGLGVIKRVNTTLATLEGAGPIEGRFVSIWPTAIRTLNESGPLGWLLGLGGTYKLPTDSQYLWLLVTVGIAGVTVFVLTHLYLAWLGWRFFDVARRRRFPGALFGLSLTSAVIALMAIYITHPALQGDRLLTMLIALSVFVGWDRSLLERATLAKPAGAPMGTDPAGET